MTDWLNACHFGDVRDVLRQMIAAGVKVNCIVTSPPYWGLRSYLPPEHGDKALELGAEPTLREFIANMADVFMLAREVLADDGTCWINMGDCYATGAGKVNTAPGGGTQGERWAGARNGHEGKHGGYQGIGPLTQPNRMPQPGLKPKDLAGQPWRLAFALQDAGWWLRQDIIWSKPNPMPESIRDRCTKAHEYIFMLTKQERYYYDHEVVKEPANPANYRERATVRQTPPGQTRQGKLDAKRGEVLCETRNKRSVWTVPSEPFKGAHFATFPSKLIEPCILAGCPPGGVVLDLFMGSGTTAMVAEQLGRKWIGIDIDRRNEALQRERLRQPSLDLEAA